MKLVENIEEETTETVAVAEVETEVSASARETYNDIQLYRAYGMKRTEQGLDFETFSEFRYPELGA